MLNYAGIKQQNFILLAVMVLVGIVPIFDNGYYHDIMYYFFWGFGLLTLFLLMFNTKEITSQMDVPLIFFLSFIVFTGLTAIWSVNPNATLTDWFYLFFYFLIFLIAKTKLDALDIKKIISFFLIIGSGIAIVGILYFLLLSSARIKSTFINPNPLGIYLAMMFLLGLSLYLKEANKKPWLVMALVLLGDALILSGSRGSVLSTIVALPFVFLALNKKDKLKTIKKLLLISLLIFVSTQLIFFAAPRLQENLKGKAVVTDLQKVLVRSQTASSVTGRLAFWQTALNMAKEQPLTGVGLGNFKKMYYFYDDESGWYSKFVHNQYLETAAETGLIGISLFLITIGGYGYNAWRGRKLATENKGLYYGLMAAALAFLLHIFVDFSWNMPAVTINFWLILGMLLALQKGNRSIGLQNGSGVKLARTLVVTLTVMFLLLTSLSFISKKIAEQGEILERERNYQEAILVYKKASSFNPLNSAHYLHLSYNYYALYQSDKKEADFNAGFGNALTALKLNPFDGYANNWIARFYYLQKDYATAELYLKKAVEAGGFKMAYYGDLADFYFSLKEPQKAKEMYLAGLNNKAKAYRGISTEYRRNEVDTEIINLHLGLAKLYEDQGEIGKAVEQLDEVLKIDEENPVALKVLKSYEQNGRI